MCVVTGANVSASLAAEARLARKSASRSPAPLRSYNTPPHAIVTVIAKRKHDGACAATHRSHPPRAQFASASTRRARLVALLRQSRSAAAAASHAAHSAPVAVPSRLVAAAYSSQKSTSSHPQPGAAGGAATVACGCASRSHYPRRPPLASLRPIAR